MITLVENDNKEVEDDVVVDWCKDAVCEYFRIDRSTLGDDTRAHISSYPRKLFWYFARCQYDISPKLLINIDRRIYDSATITIQSQTTLLQSMYNKEMKYDIDEIRKILKKKESLA